MKETADLPRGITGHFPSLTSTQNSEERRALSVQSHTLPGAERSGHVIEEAVRLNATSPLGERSKPHRQRGDCHHQLQHRW
jgi:hypothetical protein